MGIMAWTVVCAVGYRGLLILRDEMFESSVQADGVFRLTPLVVAWWPFVWGIPVLIVAGVGLSLRKRGNRTTTISGSGNHLNTE